MAKVLQCGKADWLEAFDLNVKTPDSKAAIFEDAGDADNEAHLTLFRSTRQYMFQPYHGLAEIMDRIFGSGPMAAHVTLENTGLAQDPRAYRGGITYGDDVTKPLLEQFLKQRMDAAEAVIQQRLNDWDRFDWQDGVHDLDKLVGHPDDGFLQIAILASKRSEAEVVYPPQKDAALLMKAVSIHPMQPLQNTYQRLVRDACRGIADEEKRKEKEGEQLANYFFVESVPPKPLAPPKDAEPDTEERLEQVEKKLVKLEKAMKSVAAGDAEALKELRPRAREIFDSLRKVRAVYANGKLPVPSLDQADRALDGMVKEISKARADRDYDVIHKRLTQAHRELSTALQSYCCIQNFHIIEPFYLFRLLVKFRIYSNEEIPATTVTKVSSIVTGLLHNNKEAGWLFDWLRDQLVKLAGLLKTNCGSDKVVFFLKGGRAAKYLLKIEKQGENDWDTQIVINPNLRAGEWYKTFVIVHNTVLVFLQQARAEFLTVATKNAAKLLKGLAPELDKETDKERAAQEKEQADQDELATAENIRRLFGEDDEDQDEEEVDLEMEGLWDLFYNPDDDDELAPDKNKKNCKAELIDVGLPRRDTAEAFEQWGHVKPHLIECADKMIIPGHLYYINEYVMMIREAFADKSISMPKTPKRVIRLLEVLVLPSLDSHIAEEKKKIPPALLPKSLGKIAGLTDKPNQHLLTILLKQYMEAWDLEIDKGLAAHFDDLFSTNVGAMASKATYPAALTKAIKDENDKAVADKKPPPYEAKHKTLADAIGFAQWIANDFTEHLEKDRHKFNVAPENSRKYALFAKALYTGSFFGKGEDNLELRMAITGPSAALLHANYGHFDRKKELMAVTRMDFAIFCKDDADPKTVLDIVQPVIDTYLEHSNTPKYKAERVKSQARSENTGEVHSICLYWPEEVRIGEWSYTPLAIRIVADPRAEDWPQLSFIRGLPVLGLRDLVWDLKRLTGDTEENFTHRRRKEATDALVDLLTRFENPDAGKTWVRPGYNVPQAPQQPAAADEDDSDAEDDDPPPPRVHRRVPGLVTIAQAKPNWCWAAVSAMMRNFYAEEGVTQNQIAIAFLTADRDGQGPLQLTGLTVTPGQGVTLSWDQVKEQIDGENPFIFASGVHYMVATGYEEQGNDCRVVYWDPLPTGQGRSTNMAYQYYCDLIAAGGGTYTMTYPG